MIPLWLQLLGAVGVGITALGLIWQKILRPIAKIDELAPVIKQMAQQFNTNGGSSLRDVTNALAAESIRLARSINELQASLKRVEALTVVATDSAHAARVAVEVVSALAKGDRDMLIRILGASDLHTTQLKEGASQRDAMAAQVRKDQAVVRENSDAVRENTDVTRQLTETREEDL